MDESTTLIETPSVRARAAKAIALLLGLYLLTLALAVALFVTPVVAVYVLATSANGGHNALHYAIIVACGWMPAGLLVRGLLRVRRARFVSPGPLLERAQAPALFAMLDELAARAGTAPPEEVYLSPLPDLAVSEVEGTLGIGGRRVLILGIPLLHWLSVQELRAVLAHELGHYLGGDTKLCSVIGYCETSFRSVIGSMADTTGGGGHFIYAVGRNVADTIGRVVIGGYARLYLRIMRADGRRQELAADALAVRLGGRESAVRALEKLSFTAPMYGVYLHADVARAVAYGAVPSDLMTGFEALRAHLRERGTEDEVVAAVRARQTDPHDNHPALSDRVAAMTALPAGLEEGIEPDDRPALVLVAKRKKLDATLVRETGALLAPLESTKLRPVTWAAIIADVVGPTMQSDAESLGVKLRSLHPEARSLTAMFAAVARGIATGGAAPVVFHLHPALRHALAGQQIDVGNLLGLRILSTLFEGALVERGAVVQAPFCNTGFTLHLGGSHVDVATLVVEAMRHPQGAAHLASWGDRLEAAERAQVEAVAQGATG
jgi:Zn-dependent protease with chaperone function